jgi:hypothetical protein
MINKAKLALIAAVAAVSFVSPALAQIVSPPNTAVPLVSPPSTAVPPSLFVPQTGQTFQNLPTLSGSGPGGAETFQDRAARCVNEAGVSGQAATGSVIGSCVNQ